MANIFYPSSLHFLPSRFEFGLRANVMMTTSAHNGSIQTIEMPGSRWVATLHWEGAQDAALRAEVEAFWANVRGQSNRVMLYHVRRPLPRGTVQTNGTFAASAAIGASTLSLNATTNQTLRQGDMVGWNDGTSYQLFMVTADATSVAGVINVNVTPQVRKAITSTQAYQVVSPTAQFVLTSNEVRIPYSGYIGDSFSVDLVEAYL